MITREIIRANRRADRAAVTRGRADALRARPTKAEMQMGRILTELPLTWRSQEVCRGYILDFYVPSARLCLEVDGSSHDSLAAQLKDAKRTYALAKEGISVVRFSNSQVFTKPDLVLAAVLAWANLLAPFSPP